MIIKVAIIGGSGLEDPQIMRDSSKIAIKTPYGDPSSEFITGNIDGVDVVILSRHGFKHTIPPTQVNNRANIWAIKELGCTHIISTTACGSLREGIKRGDFVILDQFIDFTRFRPTTFYDEFKSGEMKHAPMADPFNERLRKLLIDQCQQLNLAHHTTGTVITIEGPRFSTRAESHMFRSWGADVINMSVAPEAALANELEIPYASVAMATDYDCWKEDEAPVSWEAVVEVFKENVSKVIRLLKNTLTTI